MEVISLVVAALSLIWAIWWGIYTHFSQRKEKSQHGKLFEKSSKLKAIFRTKSIPSIWHVPFIKNIHFSDRADILIKLHEKLTLNKDILPQVLYGIGGVGKTQIALEYSYRYKSKYKSVFWINAEGSITLNSEYMRIANLLNLNLKTAEDQNLIREKVRDWFRYSDKWLLVYDNAEDPNVLNNYLPHETNGHILVTSQNPNWREIADTINIPELNTQDSINFIQERTGREDYTYANKIANELGGLPLALAQAAAYIDEKKKTFTEYFELFTSKHEELWGKETPPLNYKNTVSMTLNLAIETVKNEIPIGETILNLCSFLAPDNIPRALLTKITTYIEESQSRNNHNLSIDEGIEILARYSLITVEEDSLSLHRLVQIVVRDRLKINGQKFWSDIAIRILKDNFPSNALRDAASWPECIALLSHAVAAIKNSLKVKVVKNNLVRLLTNVTKYLYARRTDYNEAILFYRDCIQILESQLDRDREILALCYNDLGVWLTEDSEFIEAERCLSNSLEIRQSLNPESTNVAQTLHNFGLLYIQQSKYSDAEKYIRQSYKIYHSHFGSQNADVAMCLKSLGVILYHQNKFSEAENFLRQSIQIFQSDGMAYPELAESLYNLARVLYQQHEYLQAEIHIRNALEIYEVQLGFNHKLMSDALHTFLIALQAQGRNSEAKKFYNQYLEKVENSLGSEHTIAKKLQQIFELLKEKNV